MMKPRIEVDDGLVLLVQGQESRQPLHLLRGDMRSIQRLDSAAETLLFDLLCESGVVHRHVYALLLFHFGLLTLLLLLQFLLLRFLRGLAPRRLGLFVRLLGKDNAEIESLVDQCCLDLCQGLLDLIGLSGLMWSEELAHEEGKLQNFLATGHLSCISGFVIGLWERERLGHRLK
jgi:hypothetical protein